MNMKAKVAVSGLVLISAGVLISFQNCEVRRIDGAGAIARTGSTYTGGIAGSDPTLPPAGGGGTCAADNLSQPDNSTAVMAALASVHSSFAHINREAGTELRFVASSACYSKATMGQSGVLCGTNATPPFAQLSILLECDSSPALTVTTCTRFTAQAGKTVNLNDTSVFTTFDKITFLGMDTNYNSQVYTLPLPITSRTGTIKFISIPNLAVGSSNVFKVQLTNAKLVSDTGTEVTINGTYGGEIVDIKCDGSF